MKVSVSKAITIRNKLDKALKEWELNIVVPVNYSTVNELTELYDIHTENLYESIDKYIETKEVLYSIRKKIQEENAKGADAVISDISKIESTLKSLTEWQNTTRRSNFDSLKIDILNRDKRIEAESLQGHMAAGVGVRTIVDVKQTSLYLGIDLVDKIKVLEKELDNLKEKRNTLNLTNTITLSSSELKVLTDLSII